MAFPTAQLSKLMAALFFFWGSSPAASLVISPYHWMTKPAADMFMLFFLTATLFVFKEDLKPTDRTLFGTAVRDFDVGHNILLGSFFMTYFMFVSGLAYYRLGTFVLVVAAILTLMASRCIHEFFSNIVYIFWEAPFRVNDIIELGNDKNYRVKDISVWYTVLEKVGREENEKYLSNSSLRKNTICLGGERKKFVLI